MLGPRRPGIAPANGYGTPPGSHTETREYATIHRING